MDQIDFDGNSQPSGDSSLWARLLRMHDNGFYNVRENARALLSEGFFDEDWLGRANLNAAIDAITNACRGRNPDHTRRTVKTDRPHQYRLLDWATFPEAFHDLTSRVAAARRDEEAIRLDAGVMIRRFPAEKSVILEALPARMRPSEK